MQREGPRKAEAAWGTRKETDGWGFLMGGSDRSPSRDETEHRRRRFRYEARRTQGRAAMPMNLHLGGVSTGLIPLDRQPRCIRLPIDAAYPSHTCGCTHALSPSPSPASILASRPARPPFMSLFPDGTRGCLTATDPRITSPPGSTGIAFSLPGDAPAPEGADLAPLPPIFAILQVKKRRQGSAPSGFRLVQPGSRALGWTPVAQLDVLGRGQTGSIP